MLVKAANAKHYLEAEDQNDWHRHFQLLFTPRAKSMSKNLPIERQVAKDELKRINSSLSLPHVLIGGLAVQQYVTHRVSKDIDLICSFDTSSKIIKELYPTLYWSVLEPNDNDYRPSYRIRHKSKEGYGEIVFGPKILERGPYEDMDWSLLATDAKPFVYRANEILENILVPAAHVLAFTKLISFLTRQGAKQKVLQDLDDFIDLSNSNQFNPGELFNIIDATKRGSSILYEFHAKASAHRNQLENSCLYHLSYLFHRTSTSLDSNPAKDLGPTEDIINECTELARRIREEDLMHSDMISREMEAFLNISRLDVDMAAIRAKRFCILVIHSFFRANLPSSDLDLNSNLLLEKLAADSRQEQPIHSNFRIVFSLASSIDDYVQDGYSSLGEGDNISLMNAIFMIASWYLDNMTSQVRADEVSNTVVVEDLDISLRDVLETLDIDIEAYSGPYLRYAGSTEAVTRWYFLEPRIYTLLKHKETGRIIGYINAIPIADQVFRQIEAGDVSEMALGSDEIMPYDLPGIYRLYLCSIAITDEFRSLANLRRLVDGFLDRVIRLANDDIFIKEIVADAVTSSGVRMCEQFGFHRVALTCRETPIFKVRVLPPEFRIVTLAGSALREKCMKIYQRLSDMI